MKVYVDQETGELVEHLSTDMAGLEPYGYREAKAAHMRQSMEHRKALELYEQRVREKGAAENEYRKQLAIEIVRAKSKHGSTIAEQVAKGEAVVLEARENLTVAEGLVKSAQEYIELCKGDRVGVSQLTRASLGDQRSQ